MSSDPAILSGTKRVRPWCCFLSGTKSYAVDLKAVVEVIETEGLVRLPHSPSCILGLCTFRREVIPILRLGDEPLEVAREGRLVLLILRTEQGAWGLRIDRSGTVVAEEAMQEPQEYVEDEFAPVVIGLVRRGEAVSAVIDPESTWQRLRVAIERDFREPRESSLSAVSPAGFPVGGMG